MPRALLLAVADAARRSGLSEAAVRQRAARGTFASVRRGGRLLIPADALPADPDASDRHGVAPPSPVSAGQGDAPPDTSAVAVLVQTLREQLAVKDAQLAERAREVQELHVLLQQAQARALPAAAETPATPTRPAPPTPNGSAPRRWWHRWRR